MYFIPSLVKSDFLALNILPPPACTEFTAFHTLLLQSVKWTRWTGVSIPRLCVILGWMVVTLTAEPMKTQWYSIRELRRNRLANGVRFAKFLSMSIASKHNMASWNTCNKYRKIQRSLEWAQITGTLLWSTFPLRQLASCQQTTSFFLHSPLFCTLTYSSPNRRKHTSLSFLTLLLSSLCSHHCSPCGR